MPKVVRGRRVDGTNRVVLRGGQGGLRKIVCQSCHGQAVPQQQGDGTMLLVCKCGAKYIVKKM